MFALIVHSVSHSVAGFALTLKRQDSSASCFMAVMLRPAPFDSKSKSFHDVGIDQALDDFQGAPETLKFFQHEEPCRLVDFSMSRRFSS